MEFFRSSFANLHPRFTMLLRHSTLWAATKPHQGTCIEANIVERPCNEHFWAPGLVLTWFQRPLATKCSHQPQLGQIRALAAAE